jgi:probable HAF family extracellular repeat protein
MTGFEGFVDTGGTFTTIFAPGASDTRATGINDVGQIVGWYSTNPSNQQGYLYSGGTFTTISVPACPPSTCIGTAVSGINNQGIMVGAYTNGHNSPANGFLDVGGAFTPINVPGAYDTGPSAISNNGLIVGGLFNPDDTTHGFLYNNGTYTLIDVPGASTTVAVGINAEGEIVGTYQDGDSNSTNGFLYSDGIFTTLNVPGTTDTYLTGVNDEGQIVGYSNTVTPVPEPGSIILLASGLLISLFRPNHFERATRTKARLAE